MFENPTFWVAVAFVIFMGLLWKLGVFGSLASALDKRGEQIAADLAEARRLRDEAEALVKEYETRRRAAESEAKAIVKAAKLEAERLAAEAEAKLADFVNRRTAAAETKIAQAEANAFAEVRAAAADAALKVSEAILRETMAGKGGDAVLDRAMNEVKAQLN